MGSSNGRKEQNLTTDRHVPPGSQSNVNLIWCDLNTVVGTQTGGGGGRQSHPQPLPVNPDPHSPY